MRHVSSPLPELITLMVVCVFAAQHLQVERSGVKWLAVIALQIRHFQPKRALTWMTLPRMCGYDIVSLQIGPNKHAMIPVNRFPSFSLILDLNDSNQF
jgi:hypothetical protein